MKGNVSLAQGRGTLQLVNKTGTWYSPPENVMPAIPSLRVIGMPTAICSHVPRLSPVQMAPNRWDPAKKDRERTNGRLGVPERFMRAVEVAFCYEVLHIKK